MPRKKLVRSSQHVYHITSRSNSREWFYVPSQECWRICVELLRKGGDRHGVELHAFVLMNNHYHLMARFPKDSIDQFMRFFNKNMSDRINMATGRINRVFGGNYKWSLITSKNYYHNAIKYVYQNPVRAKLCDRVEEYPYSSIHSRRYGLKVESFLQRLDLEWLNQIYIAESQARIRKGFKREVFRPSYNSKRRHGRLE